MDEFFMEKAIRLAKIGEGKVNPNPLVGAIIVKENRIISQGYHEKFGQPHAEINAIESSRESLKDATIYVTLEPCCHYGKTPPCVDKIIENKFKRVVVGTLDPNPLVSGKGVKKLRENGIEVLVGVLEEKCKEINEIFNYNMIKNKSFVAIKWAMTLDGKIATKNYDSKWISSKKSRIYAHKLRNRFTAVMVGINTVLKDNPMLTCRLDGGVNPIKIIVDSNLKIPLECNLVKTKESKTIVATICKDKEKILKLKELGVEVIVTKENKNKVDLIDLTLNLYKRGIDSILVEGGGNLIYSILEEKIANKIYAFICPKIIGGRESVTAVEGIGKGKISECFEIKKWNIRKIDNDILIEGEV